jgi:nicotinate-nucleotide pyrophosphorylase (carboxylating)
MSTVFPFSPAVEQLIQLALTEDLSCGDLTSDPLLSPDTQGEGELITKEACVVAGLPLFEKVFSLIDPHIIIQPLCADGDPVSPGTTLARLSGSALGLLRGERTALNFIRHLSGIATTTAQYVALCPPDGPHICDTRKTTPGFRELEKYAVRMGGGLNHRFNLGAAAMIKDNHIVAAGSIAQAVSIIRKSLPHTAKIEIEVSNLEEVQEALDVKADVLLLDNMSNEMMASAVRLCRGRTTTEASGGITLSRIQEIAETGVDMISVGALTHSAPAADLSMNLLFNGNPS